MVVLHLDHPACMVREEGYALRTDLDPLQKTLDSVLVYVQQ